ncbi:MAG: DUF4339 domain-containing protein [Bacteroidales bacterium]|nr:DUF4339 domain-containing protein [Bacteroidales bacterium]
MATEWYYTRDGSRVGPVADVELKQLVRSGELARNDMVWKEGMAKWQPAGQVKGLFDDAPPQPVKTTAPPPLPETMAVTGADVIALADSPAVRSPKELKLPVIGCSSCPAWACSSASSGCFRRIARWSASSWRSGWPTTSPPSSSQPTSPDCGTTTWRHWPPGS